MAIIMTKVKYCGQNANTPKGVLAIYRGLDSDGYQYRVGIAKSIHDSGIAQEIKAAVDANAKAWD